MRDEMGLEYTVDRLRKLETRLKNEEAELPRLRGQSGSASALCLGVQPGQLPAEAGAAAVGEALVADHASGEAHQDRSEGRHARPVRGLPDGGGGYSSPPVRGYPPTHSEAEAAGTGARMTQTHEEIAGGRRGDGTGLLGSAMNASTQAALGCNMAWKRSYPAVIKQKECLPISRSTIDSSQRPTAVVGWKPSGKSRIIR
jgi:hypothetical protein